MKDAPYFLQMTARVCGGVPSPLIEPIVGRERKGPTCGAQPTPNIIIENKGPQREGALRMGSRKGKNPLEGLKGGEEDMQRPA